MLILYHGRNRVSTGFPERFDDAANAGWSACVALDEARSRERALVVLLRCRASDRGLP
jgi:hypothetical protein